MVNLPVSSNGMIMGFTEFLNSIGAFAGLLHFIVGMFIPLVIVSVMTKITEGSFKKGLEVWPLALFGGFIFTFFEMLIANLVGPELPSLLGSLIALTIFIFAVSKGFLVPKEKWDFPSHEKWEDNWEGEIKVGQSEDIRVGEISNFKAWLPYILIGLILLAGRLEVIGLTPILKFWNLTWNNIFGTSIGRGITPLYNPGIIPFILIALLIPVMHGLDGKEVAKAWKETFKMIKPATIALLFALGMTYVMMNSGGATGSDSMMIVMAKTATRTVGNIWYLVAPLVGILGAFIAGSNTVSNVMFGPFQLATATEAGLPVTPILALQALGGAAGNMFCIHNVIAALTTVGLLGKEGLVIRKNVFISILYGLLAGAVAWIIVALFFPNIL